MKYLFRILVCSLVLSSFLISANKTKEKYNKSFKVKEGGTLSINLDLGSVNVETWNKKEVKIVCNHLSNNALDDLSVIQSDNLIEFDFNGSYSSGMQKSKFTVPKNFNINARTSSGAIELFGNLKGNFYGNTASGEIELDDVDGDVDIRTAGGRIILHNVSGNLQAETLGGNIEAEDVLGKKSKVKTLGGSINLGKTTKGLSALTYGGDIRIETIGDRSNINTYGGDIKIKSIEGHSRLSTNGGDLIVTKGNGFLDARTNGGNIKVKKFTGGMDARTGAGEIIVSLKPEGKNETELSTGAGSIELTIPKKSNTLIDAKIKRYSKYDDHLIDTKLKAVSLDKSNSSVRAKYKTGNGKHKIYLITTNSDIVINTK